MIGIDVNAQVGAVRLADGSLSRLRSTRNGSLVVTGGSGPYQEASLAGNVYMAANQAGVTSQAGLSGTTPVLTLWNPPGSGVNLSLIYAGCNVTVSAATAGAIWLAQHQSTATAAAVSAEGTALVTRRAFIPASGQMSGQGKALLAATATAPIAIASFGVLDTGAITTVPEMATMGRYFDGLVIIGQGAAVSIQTGVASGASGLFCEYIWEEIAA